MASKQRHKATTVAALEEKPRRVEVDGKKFLVCLADDEVYAFRNVCPHQYGPVAEGRLTSDGEKIICPWHGWEFELDGGTNPYETGFADNLPQVRTEVSDGDVYIVP